MNAKMKADESMKNAPENHLRQALIAWLEADDANGCYSDEMCEAEGVPALSLTDLLLLVLGDYEEPAHGHIDARKFGLRDFGYEDPADAHIDARDFAVEDDA